MDFNEVYHFLFETMPGIGCLVGAILILSVIISVLLEWRTRKKFKNQEPSEEDEWFDDDAEEDSK